jgi:hypothetical protein
LTLPLTPHHNLCSDAGTAKKFFGIDTSILLNQSILSSKAVLDSSIFSGIEQGDAAKQYQKPDENVACNSGPDDPIDLDWSNSGLIPI